MQKKNLLPANRSHNGFICNCLELNLPHCHGDTHMLGASITLSHSTPHDVTA